jgi:hypothetical protein
MAAPNPYLAAWLGVHGYRRYAGRWPVRLELVRVYSWAVPSVGALNLIARHAPIVEVGAGTGYWASLLEARGVDTVPYDRAPPVANGDDNQYHRGARTWTRVHAAGAPVTARHADRSLLLCWPPHDTSMAQDALDAYDGSTVIYIGEGPGGVTATPGFFAALARGFAVTTSVAIPRWHGYGDRLSVWSRAARRSARSPRGTRAGAPR